MVTVSWLLQLVHFNLEQRDLTGAELLLHTKYDFRTELFDLGIVSR